MTGKLSASLHNVAHEKHPTAIMVIFFAIIFVAKCSRSLSEIQSISQQPYYFQSCSNYEATYIQHTAF